MVLDFRDASARSLLISQVTTGVATNGIDKIVPMEFADVTILATICPDLFFKIIVAPSDVMGDK